MDSNEGFTEIGGGTIWNSRDANLKIGDHITGIYIQHRSGVGRNDAELYTLRNDDGDQGIWGSTVLDDKFTSVSLGDIVRVTYLGESEKNGAYGKPFKLWKLESKAGEAQAAVKEPEVIDAKLDPAGEIDVKGLEKDLGY